jgi:hypothetical protein
LALAKKEHLQNLELLFRKADFSPIPVQLSGRKVEFEGPEASNVLQTRVRHGNQPRWNCRQQSYSITAYQSLT